MKRLLLQGFLVLLMSMGLYAGSDISSPESEKEIMAVVEDGIDEDAESSDEEDVEEDDEDDEDTDSARSLNAGFKIGSLGVGFDVAAPIVDGVGVRFNLNGMKYKKSETINDISYDGDLTLLTVGMLLDYFPFDNAFRVSGGAYYNGNKFAGSATPNFATPDIIVGDTAYNEDRIKRLDTDITVDNFAPYLGIGWGNDTREKGWGLSLDVGAMYHGTPQSNLDVVINSAVTAVDAAAIKADVAKESQRHQDDIGDFKFYPVIMVGLNYTF